MSNFNHIQVLFFGKKNRRTGFFCFLFSLLLFISSCSNNHCVEPMYVPLVVSFYSEMDTTLQVSPGFLLIEGVGSDSLMNASGSNSVHLSLKKFDESTSFLFTFAHSRIDTFVLVGKVGTFDSPCGNPNGDSVSVYKKNNNIFYLCNQTSNILIVSGERPEPEVLFFRKVIQDTLFVSELISDVLSIKHSNTQVFVSAECGCLTTFYLDEVRHTQNNIRDYLITNRSVTSKFNEKHIRIYIENY
jgi:hypothetical protein